MIFFLSEIGGGWKKMQSPNPWFASFDGLSCLLVLVQSHRTVCFYQAETSNLLDTLGVWALAVSEIGILRLDCILYVERRQRYIISETKILQSVMKIMKANVISRAELASYSVKHLVIAIDYNAIMTIERGTSYAPCQKWPSAVFLDVTSRSNFSHPSPVYQNLFLLRVMAVSKCSCPAAPVHSRW